MGGSAFYQKHDHSDAKERQLEPEDWCSGVTSLNWKNQGFKIVKVDFDELRSLFSRSDGWIFTVPLALVAADVYLTLIVLSTNSQIVELNPFVSSAIAIGAAALIPFIISYLALSQGLGLFMLMVGSYLFGPLKSYRYLPFVSICGAAAFGPASNLVLFLDPNVGVAAYVIGALGCAMLSLILFTRVEKLRMT